MNDVNVFDFNQYDTLLKRLRHAILSLLKTHVLPAENASKLSRAMLYTFEPDSKLLRPMLLAGTAVDLGSQDWTLIEHAATAIECVHVYSLIHDDLPAMDDDALRRGQASCHITFDESTAILAGDALLTLAFDILATPSLAQPELQTQLIHCLTQASGHQGMAQGQVLDLHHMTADTSLETLKSIYRLKTGKLIEAAVTMGMLIAQSQEKDRQTALHAFSQKLGLAFQIQDDIVDIEASSLESGKPQNSDGERTKPTYPSLMGLDRAKSCVAELKNECLNEIKKCKFNNSLIENVILSVLK